MEAILVERDYKGEYERFALTHEEFAAEFPEVPAPITESDTYTIRPLVHIWYCPVTVGDAEWKIFFTDMEDGLPDNDIESGNVAYVREDLFHSLIEEVRPFLEKQATEKKSEALETIKVNLRNLTPDERGQLSRLIEKANGPMQLSKVKDGRTFKIGDVEFIKFFDENGVTVAVTKDVVFKSEFDECSNNLIESDILGRLQDEFLPRISAEIGSANILTFKTDLTTLDGLKTYGVMTSKISLPTFDFYRDNVSVFDKYKIREKWWLATPFSAKPHIASRDGVYIGSSGEIQNDYCSITMCGARPILNFVSSAPVLNCEEECDNE